MCSFIFSTKYAGQDISDINKYLKYRGPDHTDVLEKEGTIFVHNLLSITGAFRPQPIVDDDVILVYNGEIYNYKTFGDYKSDGECIIPLYRKYGANFVTMLDGEFAICLVDFKSKIVILSTDVFKTKPMFFSVKDGEIGCASYRYALDRLGHTNVQTAKANTTYIVSLVNGSTQELPVYKFSLTQAKLSYDDWVSAFRQSVEKRIRNTEKKIFIGLSSGYDSGAIYSELLRLNCSFTTITLTGAENDAVLLGRTQRKTDRATMILREKFPTETDISRTHLAERTEPFRFTIKSSRSGYNEFSTFLATETGAIHFATVCRIARVEDCKICLSGTGADEIISDYGWNGQAFCQHSNFGGLFPSRLEDIFPWGSFYGSSMESYIAKEEYVGGAYGIEMRYPFLDTKLVQEFLWLSQVLKNRAYKAPLDYYLTAFGMPFAREKRGFS